MDYSTILKTALTKEGAISAAYSAFHNYSIGNQLLAASQLQERGLPLSPIASYSTWQEKGRQVKKGSKAIALYMPVTIKKKNEVGDVEGVFSKFILKNNWFSLDMTEGAEYAPEIVIPTWDKKLALQNLHIFEVKFAHLNGNVMGYATPDNTIAINPLNPFAHKTAFHELAHIVLGHTKEYEMTDNDQTPKDIKEVEAEGTAYILTTLLNLEGQKESRGYIQSWLQGQQIPEKSAQKIFSAANKIFLAGQFQIQSNNVLL